MGQAGTLSVRLLSAPLMFAEGSVESLALPTGRLRVCVCRSAAAPLGVGSSLAASTGWMPRAASSAPFRVERIASRDRSFMLAQVRLPSSIAALRVQHFPDILSLYSLLHSDRLCSAASGRPTRSPTSSPLCSPPTPTSPSTAAPVFPCSRSTLGRAPLLGRRHVLPAPRAFGRRIFACE